MHPFKYDVSLRIWHPDMDPEVICDRLGLDAWRKWMAGTQRTTPKGTSLNGVYESTYCCFKLKHLQNMELADFLKCCNEKFYPHKLFFEEIRSTGGTSEYFIGWYSDRNSGEVFDLDLLSKLVELGIELSLDFYGGPEQD